MSTNDTTSIRQAVVAKSQEFATNLGYAGHYLSLEDTLDGRVTAQWKPSKKIPGLGNALNGMLFQALRSVVAVGNPLWDFDKETITLPLHELYMALESTLQQSQAHSPRSGLQVILEQRLAHRGGRGGLGS